MPNSKLPIWSILALVFPLLGAAMIWWADAQPSSGTYGNGYAVAAAIFLFGGAGCVLGVISVVVALVRRERWRWLAWLALAVNLAPLVWLLTEI